MNIEIIPTEAPEVVVFKCDGAIQIMIRPRPGSNLDALVEEITAVVQKILAAHD